MHFRMAQNGMKNILKKTFFSVSQSPEGKQKLYFYSHPRCLFQDFNFIPLMFSDVYRVRVLLFGKPEHSVAVQSLVHTVHPQRMPWNSQRQECFGMLAKEQKQCVLYTHLENQRYRGHGVLLIKDFENHHTSINIPQELRKHSGQ